MDEAQFNESDLTRNSHQPHDDVTQNMTYMSSGLDKVDHDIAQNDPWLASANETQRRMVDRGWCPEQVKHLLRTKSLSIVQHLASIDKREHRDGDHSRCWNGRCSAFNVDMQFYSQQHTPDCIRAKCYQVQTPQSQLRRAIRNGRVPLISIHEEPGKGLLLRVHRRGYGDEYTSISHVWADGLGNQNANSLPACQVQNLKNLLERICGQSDSRWDGYLPFKQRRVKNRCLMFWMDTLCIPPQPQDNELRNKAIRSMPSIYHGSKRVLILDQELMSSKYNEDYVESKILSSLWMSRSWTLQEAMLPKDRLFLFADKALVYVDIQEWFEDRNREAMGRGYLFGKAGSTARCVDEIFVSPRFTDKLLADEECDQLTKLILVWNALAGRATTKAEDLYVVLATCLEFKLQPLEKLPSIEDKMINMLLSYEWLPFSILFLSGTKSTGSNRWLPAEIGSGVITPGSMIHLPDSAIRTSSNLALALGDDLCVYFLDQTPSHLSNFTFFDPISEGMSFEVETAESIIYTKTRPGQVRFYIIIEVFKLGQSTVRRGAIFHATYEAWDLVLHYICPIHARQVPRSNGHLLGRYSSKSGMLLNFHPIPKFKPLPRLVYEELKLMPWPLFPVLDIEGVAEAVATLLALIIVYPGLMLGLQLTLWYSRPPKNDDDIRLYVVCVFAIFIVSATCLAAAGRWMFGRLQPVILFFCILLPSIIVRPILTIFGATLMGPAVVCKFLHYYATQYQKFDDNTLIDRFSRGIAAVSIFMGKCLRRSRKADLHLQRQKDGEESELEDGEV